MFVLFSPSEGKRSGGDKPFRTTRHELIVKPDAIKHLESMYEDTLQAGSQAHQQAMTGWNRLDQIATLPKVLSEAPTMPALLRYSGVGFQYLDVDSLTPSEYAYLESHVIIFSHLFGPLRGSDRIPETKLKQCRLFHGINIPQLFREHTSNALRTIIGDQPVLDLRAEFYKEFFTPTGQITECVFLTNGKKVNHWSKAYRGLILRMVAKHQPKDEQDLLAIKTPGWTLVSSVEQDGKHVLTFDVK